MPIRLRERGRRPRSFVRARGSAVEGADVLLTTCLTWAVSYGAPITAACHAYMDRITARPTYGAALAANAPRTA
jgi:glutathione S-transferase